VTARRCRGDRGTAAVEAGLAVTGVLLAGFFVIGALRVVGAGGDVDAAARAAARAAAATYDSASASRAASKTATAMLADRGVACPNLAVAVGGTLDAGGVVTVSVTCTVSLADVVVAGFPGSRTLTGRGVEQVDVVRGLGRGFGISEASGSSNRSVSATP
jgi:Flp pilus assembly protein TadG